MTRSASLEDKEEETLPRLLTRGGAKRNQSQKMKGGDRYLVHRITFSPLAVRDIFLAQTGGSGGGRGEDTGRQKEGEVKAAGATVEWVLRRHVLFFLSSSSSSFSTSSSSFSSVSTTDSHDALLCSVCTQKSDLHLCDHRSSGKVIPVHTCMQTVPLHILVFFSCLTVASV